MLQQRRNLRARVPSLKPGPVQETKVLRAGRLAREPESMHIRPEILVHF